MSSRKLELGIVGLGKMGGNIALQCLDKGINVIGKDNYQ
jgi:6-phosphogluconate dehydrogenase (decarboxylating)